MMNSTHGDRTKWMNHQ